ncbi:MAG: putative quinol monooxygenase, partial [Aeromonas veronii]
MSKKVYCIAQFLPKPGQEQALFQVLQALEPNTLREDGCLQYRV